MDAMHAAVAIIPARLGSTRFPGKVLADLTGKPLVRHVWERARQASSVSRVVVATDDRSVHDVVRGFGGECVMTRVDHPNGTSRLAEAAALLDLEPERVIVNVQGDEPELEPETIDAAVAALERTRAPMATAAAPFAPPDDPADPNIVKVVCRFDGTAMYFSRSLIPFDRDRRGGADAGVLRHIGLYVYRRDFLLTFASLQPTPLERAEKLEQLRALERGFRIKVVEVEKAAIEVDTPQDLERARASTSRGG
jgi:3-deoxy-manno-octulosonate cytidylyltransferase (CMP-KDO synthetase)